MSFDASYEDGTLYMVTDVNNVEYHMMSKADVVEFAEKELSQTLNSILNANDDEESFEKAKEYLEQFSAIMEEE